MEYGKCFINIDTHNKAYMLGLIMADGCLKQVGVLNLQEDDYQILNDVKCEMGINDRELRYISPQINRYSDKGQYSFSFGKELKNLLSHVNKDKDYLPEIRKDLMPSFIRGYFDGDGCISISKYYKDKHHRILNTDDLAVVGDFYILFNKLEHAQVIHDILINECDLGNTKIIEVYGQGNVPVYKIRWGGTKNLIRIRDYLYIDNSLFMERKKIKFYTVSAGNRSNSSKAKVANSNEITDLIRICPYCNITFSCKRYKSKIFCSNKCQREDMYDNKRLRKAALGGNT